MVDIYRGEKPFFIIGYEINDEVLTIHYANEECTSICLSEHNINAIKGQMERQIKEFDIKTERRWLYLSEAWSTLIACGFIPVGIADIMIYDDYEPQKILISFFLTIYIIMCKNYIKAAKGYTEIVNTYNKYMYYIQNKEVLKIDGEEEKYLYGIDELDDISYRDLKKLVKCNKKNREDK